MDPKSSDSERKDGCISETQSIETTEDDSCLLGKRKVETTTSTPEDLSENEGDIESVVDEDIYSDSDLEWDKDSFDGREYHSSQDDSEVFFVSTNKFPPFLWAGIATVPGMDDKLEEGLTVRQFLANMTCLCVDKYNKGKGFNVKFEQVLRANFNPGGPDAPLLEYQAKVVWSAGKIYPILCRPTPPSNIYGRGGQLKEASKLMEESN
ncbi:hypothetical protein CARUB_v10016115mg [Capsella rubella]|uniref:Uncharacterized protein n=1 Tax=Capsella rubella TaxID=81985 RepID=R0HSK6_9BRAS|nr:hypothetical protein CARUB_v10016115mg [Capsella rubella]